KSGTLKKIESVQYRGRNIYALTFRRADGSNKYIYLNPDGTYVHDEDIPGLGTPGSAVSGAASAAAKEVQVDALPEPGPPPVQTETKNGPVARVLQMPNNGAVMYEVFFSQPDGKEKTIYLNPDGTYVKEGEKVARTARSWDTMGKSSPGGRSLTGLRQLGFSD